MTNVVTRQPRRPAAPRAVVEPAFRSLVRTFGLLKRVMEPYFARFGISGSHWSVLRTLHRCEEEDGLTQLRLSDLGERLIVRPPSVTGVVDRLERMGLVARVVSPDDRRVRHVSLTTNGRRLVERVLTQHPSQVSAVLAGLTSPEQQQLGKLLDRLNPHLQSLAEQQETSDDQTSGDQTSNDKTSDAAETA